jgi:hypothetical protein
MDSNPLKQYFRQPAIYVRLPSQGQHYADGSLVKTPNDEYPVLPMTTLDEITYRTPDALFNGQAVVGVIQSCMPNIKDAWKIPSIDVDTILVAIRVATYGHNLDITTKCPGCETEADYDVDLRVIMEQIKKPNYDKCVEVGDLKIFFKPMNYKEMNDSSMEQFEEQKAIAVMTESDSSEQEKMRLLGDMLKKISAMTTRALAENISLVQTPSAQVTEQEHIAEWLANCDRVMFGQIRDHIISTKKEGEIPPLKIKCGNCQHEYEQQFTLDMASFFGDAS